jgi:peroxiredoxin
MKRVLLAITMLLFFDACDTNPDGFIINGTIDGLNDGLAVLQQRRNSEFVSLDSCTIVQGKFKFAGHLDLPEMCYISIHDTLPHLRLFVENSRISIDGHIDSLRNPIITGSGTQANLDAYNEKMKPYNERLRSTYKAFLKAKNEGEIEKAQELEMKFDQIEEAQKETALEMVAQNSDNVLAPYLVWGTLAYDLSLEELRKLTSRFSPEIAESIYVVQINDHISVLNKVAIGQPYRDIVLEDPEGNIKKLSDLEGKLILVDFWASWCGPCRRENPNVVALYNEFKDKNFDIFGVSFDRDGVKWKQAIEEDQMTWHHVSDLAGWNSAAGKLYGVRAIPHTVLISPEGIIIEKNLRGEALRSKVAELTSG